MNEPLLKFTDSQPLTTIADLTQLCKANTRTNRPLLTTLNVSQLLTTIAELTQICKANALTNTPLSTAYHTQCQSASNHTAGLTQLSKANTLTNTPLKEVKNLLYNTRKLPFH